MSTDQTPALDRATGRHELFNRVPFPPACSCGAEMPDGNVRENFAAHLDDVARTTRAAVSAALHDPDDPDWLARVIYDAHGFHSADTWDTDHDGVRNHYRGHADAVRAAILGEAS